jgi:hypothetical protein
MACSRLSIRDWKNSGTSSAAARDMTDEFSSRCGHKRNRSVALVMLVAVVSGAKNNHSQARTDILEPKKKDEALKENTPLWAESRLVTSPHMTFKNLDVPSRCTGTAVFRTLLDSGTR